MARKRSDDAPPPRAAVGKRISNEYVVLYGAGAGPKKLILVEFRLTARSHPELETTAVREAEKKVAARLACEAYRAGLLATVDAPADWDWGRKKWPDDAEIGAVVIGPGEDGYAELAAALKPHPVSTDPEG